MNKITYILIIIGLITVLFSGCIDENYKEEYYSVAHNDTIILYHDYTFTEVDQTGSASGTYKPEGEKVILLFTPFGNVKSYYRNSTGLYASDGDTWRRVS